MNRITDEQTRKCLLAISVSQLCQALNAEVTHITKIDSRGKVTKKIVFEYTEDE